ncbi:MAG TPA: hypothetical protein ENN22_10145 [bacterium]|nr:hypothetical protein [bacterium]
MKWILVSFAALLWLVAPSGHAGDFESASQSWTQPTALFISRNEVFPPTLMMTTHRIPDFQINNRESENHGYKHKGKAMLRSFLIPGAGERYVGKKNLGKAFLITEVTLWIGYFAFREYANWVRQDALAYAATHAGAQTSGKPSQFFVDIGNFSNVHEYNDAQQRMRQFDKLYKTNDYFWDWENNADRRKFKNMRVSSDRAKHRAVFMLGGIFANHIISAIDAVWQTYRYNRKIDRQTNATAQLNFKCVIHADGIALKVEKLF